MNPRADGLTCGQLLIPQNATVACPEGVEHFGGPDEVAEKVHNCMRRCDARR
ncbi:hypothetical protein F4819DRAFT_484931 [Hypoxylon fuscum]|nr:hypothetical protein F4819DRAFT_484931 [Hypoxylon fuscum]